MRSIISIIVNHEDCMPVSYTHLDVYKRQLYQKAYPNQFEFYNTNAKCRSTTIVITLYENYEALIL